MPPTLRRLGRGRRGDQSEARSAAATGRRSDKHRLEWLARRSQQLLQGIRRQASAQARSCPHRDAQSRPLHGRPLDHLRHGVCCITAADHGKSLDRGDLFGDPAASAEPGEAAAQRGKRRNSLCELPPSCFCDELAAISKVRLRNRSEQHLIREVRCLHGAARASCQAVLHLNPVREKIELLFGHRIMMRAAAYVSNRS